MTAVRSGARAAWGYALLLPCLLVANPAGAQDRDRPTEISFQGDDDFQRSDDRPTEITYHAATQMEQDRPSWELRVNTTSAASSFGTFLFNSAPGVLYLVDSEVLVVNLTGGVGLVFDNMVVGATVGFRLNEATATSSTIYQGNLGLYFRYASGLRERESGFFVEPYLAGGLFHFDGADDLFTFQGGLWGGYQFFVGSEGGITVGPFAEYFNLDGEHDVVFGLQFGLSIYPH